MLSRPEVNSICNEVPVCAVKQAPTSSCEETGGSVEVVGRGKASPEGPQRPQAPSPWKTSQQIITEVQLVGVCLHQLIGGGRVVVSKNKTKQTVNTM